MEWDLEKQRRALMSEMRQRILKEIYKTPGIHFRELERQTGCATGQLEYHLNVLRKVGLIRAERDGKYLRFYPAMDGDREIENVIKHLHRSKVRGILEYLLENECATHEELAEMVGISPSALSWHMKRLVDDKIIVREQDGRSVKYSLRNRRVVEMALLIYKEGLLDKLADRLAEMWEWGWP